MRECVFAYQEPLMHKHKLSDSNPW